jgi:hypothetical protein
MVRSLILAALLAGVAMAGARAGEVADAGREAERLAAEGRNREAWDRLLRAADGIWALAPLEFRRLLFVTGEAQGYGVYDPRPTNVFKPDEAMFVYGEPFGFGYGREQDQHRIEFEVRLSVATPAGAEVIAPRSGRVALASRQQNREFMFSFAYEPQGLKPGDYLLLAEFRDTASGKTTAQRLPFRID